MLAAVDSSLVPSGKVGSLTGSQVDLPVSAQHPWASAVWPVDRGPRPNSNVPTGRTFLPSGAQAFSKTPRAVTEPELPHTFRVDLPSCRILENFSNLSRLPLSQQLQR